MRSERWYWLLGFCGLSVCIHLWLMVRSRPFFVTAPAVQTHEIEVTLAAWPDAKSPAASDLQAALGKDRSRQAGTTIGHRHDRGVTPQPQRRPAAVSSRSTVEPGGVERLRGERPLPTGLSAGQTEVTSPLFASSRPTLTPAGGTPAEPRQGDMPNEVATPEPLPFGQTRPGTASNMTSPSPRNVDADKHRVLNAVNPLADVVKGTVKRDTEPDNHKRADPDPERVSAASDMGARPSEHAPPAAPNPLNANGVGGKGAENARAAETGTGGGAGPVGPARGTPYGDVNGKPQGDPHGGGGHGGGPGGIGRGGIFGVAPQLGGIPGGHIHIVYLLDTSGSMQDGDKIGRAKEELKNALAALRPSDKFDVINFDKANHAFATGLVPATLPNVLDARNYVDAIGLGDWTNLSDALEAALDMPDVTHIYVLSDGEPNRGITDFVQLCAMVRERNIRHIRINAFALGLGEKFKGMALLRALAAENDGEYRSVIPGR